MFRSGVQLIGSHPNQYSIDKTWDTQKLYQLCSLIKKLEPSNVYIHGIGLSFDVECPITSRHSSGTLAVDKEGKDIVVALSLLAFQLGYQ